MFVNAVVVVDAAAVLVGVAVGAHHGVGVDAAAVVAVADGGTRYQRWTGVMNDCKLHF